VLDCEKRGYMELKLYLVKNRIKVHEFAEKLGCSRTHLSEVISGKKKAGTSLAKLIEFTTNGEVTEEEVISAYKPKGE
jgi:DNA-binding transcriptional regulator YdaS (Cro superfamily)